MQAGREMDALVAERVMGYQWQDGALQHDDLPGGGRCHPKSVMNPPPPYSTSIESAWQVLEKVGVDGMALINDDNGKWAVVWDGMQPAEHEKGQPFWTSYIIEPSTPWADTVPLAICLAALKASGVEVA